MPDLGQPGFSGESQMKTFTRIMLPAVLVGATLLGGCATKLNEADEARLTQAVQDAAEAKQVAQQALAEAQTATASANRAAESAQAANEKADRIFQRSLRK
jgi:outer membrane murein-binding lipoprotein Lpp